jgi:hypothetical protein
MLPVVRPLTVWSNQKLAGARKTMCMDVVAADVPDVREGASIGASPLSGQC